MKRAATLMTAATIAVLLAAAPGLAQPMALPSTHAALPAPAQSPSLQRISGTWLLIIDAAQLTRSTRPVGACNQEIALDLSGAFAAALGPALRTAFERVEEVQLPLAADELGRRKAKGIIAVRGDELRTRLLVEPGHLISHVNAAATLAASVAVTVKAGRAFEGAARGQATAKADDASMCQGGAKALADVAAAAADDAARRLATLLAQSDAVRAVKEPETVAQRGKQRPRR